jgi:integrase
MPKLLLTAKWLETVEVEDRTDFWDEGITAFGVRVSPEGRKSFFLMYWNSGRRRRLKLGEFPRLSLAQARKEAMAKLGDLARGIDPAERRDALRTGETFAEVAEQYLSQWARSEKRSWREDERILQRDVLPVLGRIKVREVTKRDILKVLDALIQRGAPIGANRTRAVISRVLSWAVDRDLVEANVCAAVRRPAAERKRTRMLNEQEIRAFWRALDDELPVIGNAFRLLLLTAQRTVEVRLMRLSQITGSNWLIPGEITKNKKPHLVPLARQALAIVQAQMEEGQDLVLASPRRHGRPLSEEALSHVARRLCRRLGFKFTPHDLRRTATTHMGKLGVERFIRGRILNHSDQSVTGVYDLYEYLREKRDALQSWADHVEQLVMGDATSDPDYLGKLATTASPLLAEGFAQPAAIGV